MTDRSCSGMPVVALNDCVAAGSIAAMGNSATGLQVLRCQTVREVSVRARVEYTPTLSADPVCSTCNAASRLAVVKSFKPLKGYHVSSHSIDPCAAMGAVSQNVGARPPCTS